MADLGVVGAGPVARPAQRGNAGARCIKLDRQVKRIDSEPARKLRIGITAVLGSSRDPVAMAYLREVSRPSPTAA